MKVKFKKEFSNNRNENSVFDVVRTNDNKIVIEPVGRWRYMIKPQMIVEKNKMEEIKDEN